MRSTKAVGWIPPRGCGRSSRRLWIFLPEKEKKETIKKDLPAVFQALRIDVNQEFEVLYEFMEKLPGALNQVEGRRS